MTLVPQNGLANGNGKPQMPAASPPTNRLPAAASAPGWQPMPGGGKLLVPPGYGNFPIPHADTFSTKVNLTARTWYNPDEAYRNNRVQQRAMRMDPVCMEPLRQRQLATALLEWSIQPEDKSDPAQRQVCDELTRWFRKIPNFIKLRLCLLEAIWYGKYAVAIDYDWSEDFTRLMLSRWRPLHGDKLRFEQETGKLGSARRISSGSKGGSNLSPIDWRYTEEFPIEIFDCNEREAIALHQHEVEDGDYWDWCFAGAVDGIGLRTRVYWPWYMKQQGLQWLMDFLQRSGVGVKIWYFEKGNARDEAEVSKIAQKYSNEMVILAPWPIGQEKPSPVLEFKEPGMGGAALIKEILDDYFGDQIHRMIVGSTLTSKTGATGLGGNVAEKHERTTMNLSEFDSINLDETITREILWVAARYNYPGIDWQPTFQSAFREQDPAALLEAAKMFQDMGGEVGENQIREVIGLSAPDESDRILEPVTRDVPGGSPFGGGDGADSGDTKSMFDNTSGQEGEQTPGGAGSEEYAGTVRYAAFVESDHPRSDDGEFTAGSGGGSKAGEKDRPAGIVKKTRAKKSKPMATQLTDAEHAVRVHDLVSSKGVIDLRDIRAAFGEPISVYNDKDPMKIQSHRVIRDMMDKGILSATQPRFGPPLIQYVPGKAPPKPEPEEQAGDLSTVPSLDDDGNPADSWERGPRDKKGRLTPSDHEQLAQMAAEEFRDHGYKTNVKHYKREGFKRIELTKDGEKKGYVAIYQDAGQKDRTQFDPQNFTGSRDEFWKIEKRFHDFLFPKEEPEEDFPDPVYTEPDTPTTQSSTPLFDESGVGQTLLGGSEDLVAPRARRTQTLEDYNVAPKSKLDPNARPEDFVFGVPGGVVEPERDRDYQPALFSAKGARVRYAAKGKWVTIGEGSGGSSVYVIDGIIRKGCPELIGQEVEEIHDTEVGTGSHADHGLEVGDIQPGHSTADKKEIIAAEPENKGPAPKSPALGGTGGKPKAAQWRLKKGDARTKRQEALDTTGYGRFQLHRDARKDGFTKEDVAALDKMAMGQVAESEQDSTNYNQMLGYARQVTGRSGKGKGFAGGDAANVKMIDDVAQELANSSQYGHYFTPDDQGDPYSDQLHSFMAGGNRPPKTYEDAWNDVMEYARESRGSFPGSPAGGKESAVPFSAKGNRRSATT